MPRRMLERLAALAYCECCLVHGGSELRVVQVAYHILGDLGYPNLGLEGARAPWFAPVHWSR